MLTLIFNGRKVSTTPCSACCSYEEPTTASTPGSSSSPCSEWWWLHPWRNWVHNCSRYGVWYWQCHGTQSCWCCNGPPYHSAWDLSRRLLLLLPLLQWWTLMLAATILRPSKIVSTTMAATSASASSTLTCWTSAAAVAQLHKLLLHWSWFVGSLFTFMISY